MLDTILQGDHLKITTANFGAKSACSFTEDSNVSINFCQKLLDCILDENLQNQKFHRKQKTSNYN
jgi:hypothetical protein